MGTTFSVACNFVYKSVFVYFVLLLFKMSMLDQAHHSCFTKIFSAKIMTQISFVLKVFSLELYYPDGDGEEEDIVM